MTEEFVPTDVGQQLPPETVFDLVGGSFDDSYFVVISTSSTGILADKYTKDGSGTYKKTNTPVFISWHYALMVDILSD